MTAIKVTHPGCCEALMPAAEVTLNVSQRIPELSHYAFICPGCASRVTKPATTHIINLLSHGGVVPKTPWEPPAEAFEEHVGPALTEDDLIVFGLALRACDGLAKWATGWTE